MARTLVPYMKPLHIDFIAHQGWRKLWLVFGVLALAMVFLFAWQWWYIKQDMMAVQVKTDAIKAQLLQQTAKPKLDDSASEHALKLLSLDLNPILTTAENIKEPGARLKQLSILATASSARLEFELDALANASNISAALNAGYDAAPWQLESVTASSNTTPGLPASSQSSRAVWISKMEKL